MPSKYVNYFGWFDYQDIYEDAVSRYNNCCFIETGNFMGRSAIYLAELIQEQKKNITLICVDLYPTPNELKVLANIGAGQGEEFQRLTALKDGHLNTFVQNITEAGVDDVIVPIKSSTHKAARIFEKGKYPFIFIDSGHGYNTVYKDMELYWPLISEGGTFAGHDFYGDTRRAVEDFFKTLDMSVESVGGSWRVRKGI